MRGIVEWLVNTGWTDEARAASIAVRKAKAEVRKRKWSEERKVEEFERQRQLSEKTSRFVGNWWPRALDGLEKDPHWGKTGPGAPYGYHETTGVPRKEPLYDRYGVPIVPVEAPGVWGFVAQDRFDAVNEKRKELAKEALKEWGRFGERKQWMEEHPGATEEEWRVVEAGRRKSRETGRRLDRAEEAFFDTHEGATRRDWEQYKREHPKADWLSIYTEGF